MSPTLIEGDIVAWTPTNIKDIKVGDVVVFKSYVHWPDEKIVVHRVNNIVYNSKGDPLLETKGDHNEWTDQAGPHIPEPYIREDHLMGKTVSFGQMPLKIPLIGTIGVLINNGLQTISKPSANKEAASNIGIFAPFTISMVILVLLIFILPEKAKTIKEKLRLNIFGRKPLKLKKTLIGFLVIYIVFLSTIHVFAYDSTNASLGVQSKSPDSQLNFGSMQPGTESTPQAFPIVNPSTMPVKGLAFAKGEMKDLISPNTFQIESGEAKNILITAAVPNMTHDGGYFGNIMIYSSPFWLIFPDDFLIYLINWNSEFAIFALDLICAIILTAITMAMLVSISFATEKINNYLIDSSWRRPSKIIIKKKTSLKLLRAKRKFKSSLGNKITWIFRSDLIKEKETGKIKGYIAKPIIAALFTVPLIFLIEDKILAMFISIILTGLIAYFISCKLRSKLIITTIIAMTIAIVHMAVQSNLIILSKGHTNIEIMALSVGVIGVYLLLFCLLLIPFALLTWLLARLFRNLKERKDPLLSLEGSCDL